MAALPARAGFFGPAAAGPISVATVTITQNGVSASPGQYPATPWLVLGKTNTYLQAVIQNLSNGTNASGDLVITNDLGGDTSYYFNIGVNSSKFSQALQSAEASSSTYVTSSDSPLLIWADTNAGQFGGNGHVIIGSSNPVTGNIAVDISSNAVVFQPSTPVTISSAAFIGVQLSTQAAGGAGSSVTALCSSLNVSGLFALGGGCSCASGVALTSTINFPNCATAGCHPTGWTCQDAGGTGGQCSAYAICSRAQ